MWSLPAGGLALMAFLVLGLATLPVPFVSIGLGPTFNTLGDVNGTAVVRIDDMPTFPTSGHLNMTTVGVNDGLTALDVLRFWAAGDHQVVPRTAIVPPGETPEEATVRNAKAFADSQTAAKAAALGFFGAPVVVYIDSLSEDSPARGLLQPGDVLVEVAGRPVTDVNQLRSVVSATPAGQPVVVRFRRNDGPAQDTVVTLGARPDTGEGILGVLPASRPVRDNVVISLGEVGGPSAGLMFALAIVDKLTPGELTGGRFIAGTGTISPAGDVGKIEGIRFKMRAARDAGATVFLVPEGNCEAALQAPVEGLQLIKVSRLPEAVDALTALRAGGVPASC